MVTGFVDAVNLELGDFVELCSGMDLGPGQSYSSYEWSTGAMTPSISVSASGLYWLEVEDENGCTDRDSLVVSIEEGPSAEFMAEQNGCTFWFQAQSPFQTFEWNFGDGQSSTELSPFHTYAVPGEYLVRLIASNVCGMDTVLTTVSCMAVSRDESLDRAFQMFPNPASEWIDLKMESPFGELAPAMRLFSSNGKRVPFSFEKISDNTYRIYIASLPEGIYSFQALFDNYSLQQHIWVLHP